MAMEKFWIDVYAFFSQNMAVLAIVLGLTVIATVLEKTTKIFNPIKNTISKHICKKMSRRAKQSKMYEDISMISDAVLTLNQKTDTIESLVGNGYEPLNELYNSLAMHLDSLDSKIDKIEHRILDNEADRLRDVLFACGNQCRRRLPLDGESYRHIQDVYIKYYEDLKQNGIGQQEYEFITSYYNTQEFDDK